MMLSRKRFVNRMFAAGVLRYIILTSTITQASAAETSNSTTSATQGSTDAVGFILETQNRDTVSLVISCVLTLGLCVYSALHLNVPPKDETYFGAFWRQTKWCFIALLAPELVLYMAWKQWASARSLFRAEKIRKSGDVEALSDKDGARKVSNMGAVSLILGTSVSIMLSLFPNLIELR